MKSRKNTKEVHFVTKEKNENSSESDKSDREIGSDYEFYVISINTLKKLNDSGTQTILFNYRNTPIKGMGYSPSQLSNSRICKTKVPIVIDLFQPICISMLKIKFCQNVRLIKLILTKQQRTLNISKFECYCFYLQI